MHPCTPAATRAVLAGLALVAVLRGQEAKVVEKEGRVVVTKAGARPMPAELGASLVSRDRLGAGEASRAVLKMSAPEPEVRLTFSPTPAITIRGSYTEALGGVASALGSARRFDYALLGDAVNFASRLEGANKQIGTTILLAVDSAQLLGGRFLLRRLGSFTLKGKAQAVVIHELIGDNPADGPVWLDRFEAGLAAWSAGDLAPAGRDFKAADDARDTFRPEITLEEK